ncbi:MAG: T9SS type A sorting domain-containing protein, partial [Cytophagales bacterium]
LSNAQIYQWYVKPNENLGERLIVGRTTNAYEPKFNGQYFALLGYGNGCFGFSNVINITNFTNDISRSGFLMTDSTITEIVVGLKPKVYPNPTFKEVYIEFYGDDLSLEMHDVNGSMLNIPQTMKDGKIILDLSEQRAGVYILMLKFNNQLMVERIVLMK